MTEAVIDDLPDVAKPLGVETTTLIDRLTDENQAFVKVAMGHLRENKDIFRLQ